MLPPNEDWNEEHDITVQEVYNIVKKRSISNKAPGMDGIKSIFLKKIPDVLLIKMTDIFNMYLKKGLFPELC